MIGALFLSQICIAVFFPNRSPLLRSNVLSYVSQQISDLLTQAGSFIPKFTLPSFTVTTPEENSTTASSSSLGNMFTSGENTVASGVRQQLGTQKLTPSSPGIYVTSNNTSCLTVLNQKEASWVEYNVSVSGKPVKIRVPSGQAPPSSEVLSQIY